MSFGAGVVLHTPDLNSWKRSLARRLWPTKMQRRASQDYLPVKCAESSSISAFWSYSCFWDISLSHKELLTHSFKTSIKTHWFKKNISLVHRVVYIGLLWVPFLGWIGMYGRCVHDVSGCGRCACCIFPGKSYNRLRQGDLSSSPVYAIGKTPSQNQSLRKTWAIGELSR